MWVYNLKAGNKCSTGVVLKDLRAWEGCSLSCTNVVLKKLLVGWRAES